MKKLKWLILGILAYSSLFWGMAGIAQAGVILPVDPATLKESTVAGAPTISIYQLDSVLPTSALSAASPSRCQTTLTSFYKDVTDCWLSEWNPTSGGKSVYVVVNGVAVTSISLAAPLSPFLSTTNLTTSAYPGNCTNFGTDTGADFAFVATSTTLATSSTTSVTGYQLTPNDCGGMAVIKVNGTYKFIIPKDGTSLVAANGIPEIWENLYGGNRTPGADADPAPVSSTITGDGIADFDEYRGFIASGEHIRTDPRQKDLFVHLVNPQCVTGTQTSLLGGGTTTYPTDGSSIFSNLNTLTNGTQIHPLGYTPGTVNYTAPTEWLDNFDHILVTTTTSSTGIVSAQASVVYRSGTTSAEDRRINANAVYPKPDPVTGNTQKGLRITECLDTQDTNNPPPFGDSGWGSANGPDNAIIYTNRIVNKLDGLIGTNTIKYSTFVTGAWSAPVVIDRNNLISKAIEFYLAMEIGHSVKLTPTTEGTSRTSYGYHHAPKTGSNLDQAIVSITKSGVITFYIPSVYNSTDQASFRLKN